MQWQACAVDACDSGESRDCIDAEGVEGTEFCLGDVASGTSYWGGCETDTDCTGGGAGGGYGEGCSTPLVLSFDGAAVEYTTEMAGAFDLTGLGVSRATDWPTAATPWLALDRDGNGAIDGGGELFGSATKLADGSLAVNGFVALRALDDDGDGVIDARDAAFARLALWADRDASRTSEAGELTAASSRLVAIDLVYTSSPACDARGNCEVERAAFRYLDAGGATRTGAVVDIHLRTQR